MPQVFKIGGYVVFFWLDEGKPLEPVHVHIAEGVPTQNATKVWITHSGKTLVAYRRSDISSADLRKILRVIEANSELICQKWTEYFNEIRYFC